MPRRIRLENDLVVQVGARIRRVRLASGLSLRRVASLGGCSADSIMEIELGRTAINVKTLARIARALDVQPFDLLNHDVERDDVGFLIEAMRRDPNCVQFIRDRVQRKAA